jgi:signal transduction histidine kinase
LTGLAETLSKPNNFLIEIQKGFPVLFTEEVLLYQVFSNLLSNAVKYNNKKAGRVNICCGQTEEGMFYYCVEDNGPGIPVKKRHQIFKMFTVLQKGNGFDSTGIGLAIVKKIINEKGGKIWIEDASSWDSGSRFCFTWPAEVLQ